MANDNRDKTNLPDEDRGRFLFVNKTVDTLERNANESFTISSHVSKMHRKWLKQERLRKLHASSSKTVSQRSILAAGPLAEGSSTLPLRLDKGSRPAIDDQQNLDNKRALGAKITQQHTSSSSIPWNATHSPGAQSSQPVYPFKISQDNDDQQEEVHQEHQRTKATNRYFLTPFRGNSDPFSVAALPLAAQDHDIIRQARQFLVFVGRPDKTTAVWRAPIADTSNSQIQIRQTIANEAEIHAILAAGYAVNVKLFKGDHARSLAQSLYHKTKAVELLRDRLYSQGFSRSVTTLIRLLISLDFEASDNESALVHLRGLWAMAATTPGTLADAQDLLLVSDVWISMSLLKPPEIRPSLYDPGPRERQHFGHTLSALGYEYGIPPIGGYATSHHADSALDEKTWSLLKGSQEVIDTKALMEKIRDPRLLNDVIQWMSRRSIAVTAFCVMGYVENSEIARSPGNPDPLASTLMAAACMSGTMFMNFKFLDFPTNFNFGKTCQKIEAAVRRSSKPMTHTTYVGKLRDYLWLLFLTAMGTDIFTARGDISYSSWPAVEFHRVCGRLHLDTARYEIVAEVLGSYPHYEEMDVFLVELLTAKEPVGNIISWSEWRVILNHA